MGNLSKEKGREKDKIKDSGEKKDNNIIPFVRFINIRKRELKNSSDFSFQKMKSVSLKYLEQVKGLKDDKLKIEILETAIKFDNTNENILKEYLICLKKFDQNKYQDELDKYLFHISPKVYESITGEIKEKTSITKLKKIFDLFKNYDKNSVIYKKNIVHFFNIEKINLTPVNSYNNLNEQVELSIIELYYLLYKEVNHKIIYLKDLFQSNELTLDEKIQSFCPITYHSFIKSIFDTQGEKISENFIISTLILYSQTFLETFYYIRNYINQIYEIIDKCLKLENLKEDYYILLFIILDLKNLIYYDMNKSNYLDMIIKYKTKNNYDNLKYEINNNTLIINNRIKIEDYQKYQIDKIVQDLNLFDVTIPNEFLLIPYLKIEYFNDNNYVKYLNKFIELFNEKISKSKTISTLLNYLYPGFEEINLFQSEFIENIFKNSLKNAYFFPFSLRIGAKTLKRNNTILFFIPNRSSEFKENLISNLEKKKHYIIGNLGVFIYIEFHEVLGHYLRAVLSKITTINYLSPRSPISEKNVSGESIESLLFGKRISNFTFIQLLYILDTENYKVDYKTFRNNFLNISNYIPSTTFKEMLRENNISLNALDLKKRNVITSNLFNENNLMSNSIAELPLLNDCVEDIGDSLSNYDNWFLENFEECQEKLINILKKTNQ